MRAELSLGVLLCSCGVVPQVPVPIDTADPTDTSVPAATGETGAARPAEVTLLAYEGSVQRDLPFVAFQDGDGPWTAVTGQAGLYRMPVTDERYGIVWVCVEGVTSYVRITSLRALTTELHEHRLQCPSIPASELLSGTVSSFGPETSYVQIALGAAAASVTPALPDYAVYGAPGRHDVLAGEYRADGSVSRVWARRDELLTTFGPVDVDLDEALATEPITSTIEDPYSTGDHFEQVLLFSEGGSSLYLGGDDQTLAPAAFFEGDDVQVLSTITLDDSTRREARAYLRAPRPVSLTLPPTVGPITVYGTVDDVYARVHADVVQANVQMYGLGVWTDSGATVFHHDHVTEGWRAAAGGAQLGLPALAGLEGWDRGWEPAAGAVLRWHYRHYTGAGDLGQLFAAVRYQPATTDTDGLVMEVSERNGLIQP